MAREFKAFDDALNEAIDNGDLTALRAALASGADLSRWLPTGAESAVMFAIMSDKCVEVLELLRAAGLDMAGRTPEDEEPGKPFPRADRLLSQTLFGGVATPQVVHYLLAQGADVNRREYDRPLLSAFLRRGADVDLGVLDALLDAQPDLDAVDADGATALMHAAGRDGGGRAEALERLLARGADATKRDQRGKSVADYAAAVPAESYLDVLRRHLHGVAPPAVAVPMAAHDLQPGSFFVLEPVGVPLAWRWSAPAASAAAAFSFVESRYGTSRSPIGPFPVLQLVSATDRGRAADPFAARHAGTAAPGSLLVLTHSALVAEDPYDEDNTNQRPIFVVAGVFGADARAAAQALAAVQRGWSLVARLESLTMMTDGYADPVAAVKTG